MMKVCHVALFATLVCGVRVASLHLAYAADSPDIKARLPGGAQISAKIDVNTTNTKAISPILHGIFFEELNNAGDGGLYAEKIRDRSFDGLFGGFAVSPNLTDGSNNVPAWSGINGAIIELGSLDPINPTNKRYARVSGATAGMGLSNTGYWGISLMQGEEYYLSLYVRCAKGNVTSLNIHFHCVDTAKGCASLVLSGVTGQWQRLSAKFPAEASSATASLEITFDGPAELHFDHVSLFPAENILDEHKNPYPFRKDILALLKEVKPRFMRFPGGCYVEGNTFEGAFNWLTALGPVEGRPGHPNQVWGYWSNDGLGLYEYLLLAEELGAEPVWVVNSGNSHWQAVPTAELADVTASALHSIEFITGPANSTWGKVRAAMGHPAPFPLVYMAIGNENCGSDFYFSNFLVIKKAIKARYPHMQLIGNCLFTQADLYDFHIYSDAVTIWNQRGRFDNPKYREGPRVFVSEYATKTFDPSPQPGTLRGAVAEAGFLTGLERNGDIVAMASYAPLLVNDAARVWSPDSIVFNTHSAYGVPSYWTARLFAEALGDTYVDTAVAVGGGAVAASTTCSTPSCDTLHVKLVNFGDDSAAVELSVLVPPGRQVQASAKLTLLTSAHPDDYNSFDDPLKVSPRTMLLTDMSSSYTLYLPPYAVSVLQLHTAPATAVVR